MYFYWSLKVGTDKKLLIFDTLSNLLYTINMKEIIVNEKYNGKKLNNFLLDTFPGLSPNLFYKTLRKKDIRVNNVKIAENITLSAGDKISIYLSDEQLTSHYSKLIDIVYKDDNILVLNKPSGIEVTGENSLSTILNLAPCHRLDRNTTGLVLFAKNEETLSILLEKFKHHEIEKHYRATVIGIPAKATATLIAYLFKDAKKSLVYISDVPKKGYEKIGTNKYRITERKFKAEIRTGKFAGKITRAGGRLFNK